MKNTADLHDVVDLADVHTEHIRNILCGKTTTVNRMNLGDGTLTALGINGISHTDTITDAGFGDLEFTGNLTDGHRLVVEDETADSTVADGDGVILAVIDGILEHFDFSFR